MQADPSQLLKAPHAKNNNEDGEVEDDDKFVAAARKQKEIADLTRKEQNRREFADETEAVRQSLEGFRQGCYVRVLIRKVSADFLRHFRPHLPVILGGLLPHERTNGEANMGYLQARVKRHRWHKRILKSNDPVIFSVGWRRFQVGHC